MTDTPSTTKIAINAQSLSVQLGVVGGDDIDWGLVAQDGSIKLGLPRATFPWLEPGATVIAFLGITYARTAAPAQLLVPTRPTLIKPN